jgi:hypothetical protein
MVGIDTLFADRTSGDHNTVNVFQECRISSALATCEILSKPALKNVEAVQQNSTEIRNASEISSPARFCFCAASDLNKSTCSEEIANKMLSQLQPLGCRKKRFDGC